MPGAFGSGRRQTGKWRPHALCVDLRKIRREKKITVVALAKKIGSNRCTLSQWESGKYSPSVRNLTNWAQALGLEIKLEDRA